MQAMHDEPSSLEQQLNTDWKLLVARDAFRRFVSAEDVDVRTGRCRVDKVCVCGGGGALQGGKVCVWGGEALQGGQGVCGVLQGG